MASILRVNTLTDASSNNSTAVSTINQGTAKAWFNLNAATPALRDSFNITSITDEGTGTYEGVFTSAMGNGDYSATGLSSVKGSVNSYSHILTTGADDDTYGLHSTAAIRANVYAYNGSTFSDPQIMQLTVHGDLA